MSKERKIIIPIIAFLIIGLLVIFSKNHRSNQHGFGGATGDQEANADSSSVTAQNQTKIAATTDDEGDKPGEYLDESDKKEDQAEEAEVEEDMKGANKKDTFLDVRKKDCDNRCKNFEKDQEDFNYCREVCGLNAISKNNSPSECEDKEGLEVDYCFRDAAVSKNDYSLCDKIEDAGITRMCQNRITENLMKNSAQ